MAEERLETRICNEITDAGLVKSYVVEPDFPVLKQMTVGPVIHYLSTRRHGDLVCQCGNILITNYLNAVFLAVAIECNRCKQLTLTPKLPHGEILPTGLDVIVLPNRDIHINVPAYIPINKVMTGSSTLKQDQAMFNPVLQTYERKSYADFISSIEDTYDSLTKGCLKKHLDSVKRGLRNSAKPNAEYPLPWALNYLRDWKSLSLKQMNSDKNFTVAMHFLVTFYDAVSRWRHHPVFEEFGKIFSGIKSFHHNVTQLTAATMLVQNGNRVGLAKAVGQGIRTPDMYINFAETGRLHMEVKAPEAFQWASTAVINNSTVKRIIKHQLESSQINSLNPGVLVIGCTRFSGIGRINKVLKDTLEECGQSHRSVAGVCIIHGKSLTIANKNDSGIDPGHATTNNQLMVNSHYKNPSPFRKRPKFNS